MRTHHSRPHSPPICIGGLAIGERSCWPYLTAASLSSFSLHFSRDGRVFLEKEVLVDDLVNECGRDFFGCLKFNICKGCGIGELHSPHLDWEREELRVSSCEHGGCPVIEVLAFVE